MHGCTAAAQRALRAVQTTIDTYSRRLPSSTNEAMQVYRTRCAETRTSPYLTKFNAFRRAVRFALHARPDPYGLIFRRRAARAARADGLLRAPRCLLARRLSDGEFCLKFSLGRRTGTREDALLGPREDRPPSPPPSAASRCRGRRGRRGQRDQRHRPPSRRRQQVYSAVPQVKDRQRRLRQQSTASRPPKMPEPAECSSVAKLHRQVPRQRKCEGVLRGPVLRFRLPGCVGSVRRLPGLLAGVLE
eukprot:SAG31_NODE_73_length_27793_cov_26.900520_15_plen_246_part_00